MYNFQNPFIYFIICEHVVVSHKLMLKLLDLLDGIAQIAKTTHFIERF